MFDLGFIADIRFLMRRLPPPDRRLSMLFSATLSQRVLELAYEHMNNPELVRIEPDKMTVDRVRQIMYYPSMEEKVPLLIALLRQADARRTMIFVNTKRMAERLESVLNGNGFNAQAISGDVPQPKRLRFLRDFRRLFLRRHLLRRCAGGRRGHRYFPASLRVVGGARGP